WSRGNAYCRRSRAAFGRRSGAAAPVHRPTSPEAVPVAPRLSELELALDGDAARRIHEAVVAAGGEQPRSQWRIAGIADCCLVGEVAAHECYLPAIIRIAQAKACIELGVGLLRGHRVERQRLQELG